jgi:hypothetical protein
MAELENGIGLFKLARRDETVRRSIYISAEIVVDIQTHLERLATVARRALHMDNDKPEDDLEDLDLLSARKTYRRPQQTSVQAAGSIISSETSTDLMSVHAGETAMPADFDAFEGFSQSPTAGQFDMDAVGRLQSDKGAC